MEKMEESTNLTINLIPNNNRKRRDVLASIMISNCGSDKSERLQYLKKLQKHINIDVYGKCGKKFKNA